MKLSELIAELIKLQTQEDCEVILWAAGELYSLDDVTTAESATGAAVELSGELLG